MLSAFLPECIAPSTRVHCATNNTRLWHRCGGVLCVRGLRLRQVSGYGLLWFTCKAMWARSCLTFTTLAVVVNAEFESLEIWTINCGVLIKSTLVTITSDASYMYVLICRYCFLADNLEISICCHLVQGEFRAQNTQILYLLRSIYIHLNIMNVS